METSFSESSQWLITHRFDNDGTSVGHPRLNPRIMLKLYSRYRKLLGDSNRVGRNFSVTYSSGTTRYLITGSSGITPAGDSPGFAFPYGRDYRWSDCVLGNYSSDIWPGRYWQEAP